MLTDYYAESWLDLAYLGYYALVEISVSSLCELDYEEYLLKRKILVSAPRLSEESLLLPGDRVLIFPSRHLPTVEDLNDGRGEEKLISIRIMPEEKFAL
ncbi:MAG: hypothetical protein F6K24_02095 [Okeania sp. SIO2D1]|nr:hypothetical protein [Okeania sp. SIO2D1]